MHISMFYGEPEDFIQVVVLQERYQEKLLNLGWRKTPEELQVIAPEEEIPELPPVDPVIEQPAEKVEPEETKPEPTNKTLKLNR